MIGIVVSGMMLRYEFHLSNSGRCMRGNTSWCHVAAASAHCLLIGKLCFAVSLSNHLLLLAHSCKSSCDHFDHYKFVSLYLVQLFQATYSFGRELPRHCQAHHRLLLWQPLAQLLCPWTIFLFRSLIPRHYPTRLQASG